MIVAISCLVAFALLGWSCAYHQYRLAQMNQRHYRIAMDGWRAEVEHRRRINDDWLRRHRAALEGWRQAMRLYVVRELRLRQPDSEESTHETLH